MTVPKLAVPALCLLLALPVAAATSVVPTLPVAALHAGQRAVVHTVFAGDSIETFDAELLGVLEGGRAQGDIILARALGERVERTGVAEGMSGSPVYVDGKLIGALSSGWSFSREPIFGITPIAEMLAVLDQPTSPRPDGTAGPIGVDPLPGPAPRFREMRWPGDDDSLALVPPAAPAPSAVPHALRLPLAAGGLQPQALDAVRDLFRASGFTVTPGGRARRDAKAPPQRLVPGSPVAVDVLRGDANMSAIGTVTYVDGDRVLIFGHPFFQSGEVRMPLSTASILGILPSYENSFKLGVPGTMIGTATQDRRAAVGGTLGPVPQLLPLHVTVESAGRPAQSFRFESIEDRGLLPQLVATVTANSILESGGLGAQQSLEWSLAAYRHGAVLRVHDVAASEQPLSDMVGGVVAPLRFLYNNPFERLRLDSLVVRVAIRAGRDQYTLRAAQLAAPSVRPGGTLRVRTELEAWRGERRAETLTLDVPRDLPDGRYLLWLGGGAEADRFTAARLPGRFRPTSLGDAWQRFAASRSSDAVYAVLWSRAPEVTSDGEDYPDLPGSAMAVFSAPQSSGDHVRRGDWAVSAETVMRHEGVVRGELALEVVVDSKAP